jgi:hypothetical protein
MDLRFARFWSRWPLTMAEDGGGWRVVGGVALGRR